MAANRRDKMIRDFVSRPIPPIRGRLPQRAPQRGVYAHGKPGTRITEDDPRWNASTMGDRTGMYRGRWYEKGKKVPFDMRGQ